MNALSRNLVIRSEWQDAKQAGKSRAEFAAWLGVTPKALDSILQRAKDEELYNQTYEPVDMGEPEYIMGDAVIIGDVHAPFHDISMISRACYVARRNMVDTLIIAGDLLNLDYFSRYLPETELPTWQDERESTRRLIKILGDTFDRIYWLMGNHERRFSKATGMWADDLVSLCKPMTLRSRVHFHYSPFGWCVLDSQGVQYRVTHPKDYSKQPGKVGDVLANKFGMHIISFHEHHLSMHKSTYGNRVVINGGCMVDQDRLMYATLDDSTSADMSKGFVSVIDGYARIYDDGVITDWSDYNDDVS